jgi:hypothetical protein
MVLAGVTIARLYPTEDNTDKMMQMRNIISNLILVAIALLLVVNFGITAVEIVRQTIRDIKRKYALSKALRNMNQKRQQKSKLNA